MVKLNITRCVGEQIYIVLDLVQMMTIWQGQSRIVTCKGE